MLELIKKTALAGVGAASFTAEKVEELAKELVEKGKMTEIEGRKFVDEMQDRAEESKKSIKKYAENTVEQAVAKMKLAQSSDIRELRQEISLLRAELEEIRKRQGGSQ